MAEAGYAGGFKASVFAQASDVDNLSIVKDYWKKNLNVDLEFDIKEASVYMAVNMVAAHKELATFSGYFFATAAGFHLYGTGSPTNVDDPKMVDMIQRYSDAWNDSAKQLGILRENSTYIVDQAWYIWWPVPNMFIFWQPWVKNFYGSVLPPQREFSNIWIDQDLKKTLSKN